MSLFGKISGILSLTLVVYLALCFRLTSCLDIWLKNYHQIRWKLPKTPALEKNCEVKKINW